MLRLGFECSEGVSQSVELTLFIWQDRAALTVPYCHINLPAGSDRAWLVTSENSPKIFDLEANGVVRGDTVPDDVESGKGRAVSRLRSLLN